MIEPAATQLGEVSLILPVDTYTVDGLAPPEATAGSHTSMAAFLSCEAGILSDRRLCAELAARLRRWRVSIWPPSSKETRTVSAVPSISTESSP